MIIRSKFTDYYDFVAHQNRDPKVVYDRKIIIEAAREIGGNRKLYPSAANLSDRFCWQQKVYHWSHARPRDEVHTHKDLGLLLIAGKAYPFSCVHGSMWLRGTYYKYLNDRDTSDLDISQHAKLKFTDPYKDYDKWTKKDGKIRSWHWRPDNLERLESGVELPDAVTLCRQIAPVIIMTKDTVVGNIPLRLIKYPCDPHIVFQEISSFLMSVEPYVPEMDDKTKRDAHGFDDMTFKREPGGPTRKRKKLLPNDLYGR